jgi:hypothetical protein
MKDKPALQLPSDCQGSREYDFMDILLPGSNSTVAERLAAG